MTPIGRGMGDGGCAAGGQGSADSGAAAVLGAFAAAAVVAITVMVIQVAAAVSAQHRAQAAADLAAVSAATALDRGVGAACEAARRVTEHAGARLVECTPIEWDVGVTAEIPIRLGPFVFRVAGAAALAGPSRLVD